MHKASLVLAAGANFRLLGPAATRLCSTRPVVAVCAVRTGCGKSQTVRRVARILADAGRRVVLIRHPMPYGDLEAMRVQRFATLADIDAADPTVEEREEYEMPVRAGMVMYAGVDYEAILRRAEAEADVIVWDGGYARYPDIGPVLPAMGYGEAQLRDLAATVEATPCDVVVSGTPADLGRLLESTRPIRQVIYELEEVGTPTLTDVLAPFLGT